MLLKPLILLMSIDLGLLAMSISLRYVLYMFSLYDNKNIEKTKEININDLNIPKCYKITI